MLWEKRTCFPTPHLYPNKCGLASPQPSRRQYLGPVPRARAQILRDREEVASSQVTRVAARSVLWDFWSGPMAATKVVKTCLNQQISGWAVRASRNTSVSNTISLNYLEAPKSHIGQTRVCCISGYFPKCFLL